MATRNGQSTRPEFPIQTIFILLRWDFLCRFYMAKSVNKKSIVSQNLVGICTQDSERGDWERFWSVRAGAGTKLLVREWREMTRPFGLVPTGGAVTHFRYLRRTYDALTFLYLSSGATGQFLYSECLFGYLVIRSSHRAKCVLSVYRSVRHLT